MSGIKISALPAANAANITDELEANQSGISRRITVDQVFDALLQTAWSQIGTVATGTTIIPVDNTIPQITEGTEFMTLAITPRSVTSKLLIDVVFNGAHSTAAGAGLVVALFVDATANALAACVVENTGVNAVFSVTFRHAMVSGTTNPMTFRVRAGGSTAGTMTFNGAGGVAFMGGVMASSIIIREVPA